MLKGPTLALDRVIGERLERHRVDAVGGDAVGGEGIAEVFEIGGRDGLGGVEGWIAPGGGGVVEGDDITGGVDGAGEIADAFAQGGDGGQVGAGDALADALIGEGKEGLAAAVVKLGKVDRAGDVEAELVAAQQALFPAALTDLVRHGVQDVVAQVLIQPAVELSERAGLLAGGAGAVGAQAESAGLDFELFYSALDVAGGRFGSGGRGGLGVHRRQDREQALGREADAERSSSHPHAFSLDVPRPCFSFEQEL